jgi:hypothetical protein
MKKYLAKLRKQHQLEDEELSQPTLMSQTMADPLPRRHAYPKVTLRDQQTYLAGTEVTRIKSLLREMR